MRASLLIAPAKITRRKCCYWTIHPSAPDPDATACSTLLLTRSVCEPIAGLKAKLHGGDAVRFRAHGHAFIEIAEAGGPAAIAAAASGTLRVADGQKGAGMGEALTLPQRTAHITDEAVCHCLSGRDCHQQYCSAPVCRAASNAASQARWLAKPENQGYFRGPENVARVQAWRSPHPGYWRGVRRTGAALQEASPTQPVDSTALKTDLTRSPLQDVLTAQPAVLIGLIAHIVGTPLQDDIVRATGRLLRLGQHILAYPRRRQQCPRPTGIVD